MAHIEFDERSQSLEEELIKEFLDEASQFTWSSVDFVLESQGKLKKKFLEFMINKFDSLDVEKMRGKDTLFPGSVQAGKFFFISGRLSLLAKWFFFVLLRLFLLWNFLWGLPFFGFELSLLSLQSGLFCFLSFGGCFLIDSEEHWVGGDVSVEFVLVDLGLKGLVWRVVPFDHVDDFLKSDVGVWSIENMSFSKHVQKLLNFNGNVLSSVIEISRSV